ncbi:MAG TPA: hypothetical protein VN037_04445 [Verrucomicrobiae bacterium]|nr:hypothetical protein [Verrucomicrobiae bacterium]
MSTERGSVGLLRSRQQRAGGMTVGSWWCFLVFVVSVFVGSGLIVF